MRLPDGNLVGIPHEEYGDNGHREDATHFVIFDPVQNLEEVFT